MSKAKVNLVEFSKPPDLLKIVRSPKLLKDISCDLIQSKELEPEISKDTPTKILISKAIQDQIQKEPPQKILEWQGVFLEDFKDHLPPIEDKSHTIDFVTYTCSLFKPKHPIDSGQNPFEANQSFKPKRPIDLGQNPLEIISYSEPKIPIDQISLSTYANSFAQHVRDLHRKISPKINISNELYKNLANSQKWAKEFYAGDFVMIRLRLEWFPSGTIKKLHAHRVGPFKTIKRVGPNAYMLELSSDLGISTTFNISDIVKYRKPAAIPSKPFGPIPSLKSKPILECPPSNWPSSKERIERILDDQAISIRNKGYQRYLVRWQGQLESEDSWIAQEDLQCLNPDLLEQYESRVDPYSTGSSSS